MTSSKFASIFELTVSHPVIVEFAQHHQGEDLNIAGYTDVTNAEVVVTTT